MIPRGGSQAKVLSWSPVPRMACTYLSNCLIDIMKILFQRETWELVTFLDGNLRFVTIGCFSLSSLFGASLLANCYSFFFFHLRLINKSEKRAETPGFYADSSSSFTSRRFKEFGKLEREAEKWIGFEGNRICTSDPRTGLRMFPYRGAPRSRIL